MPRRQGYSPKLDRNPPTHRAIGGSGARQPTAVESGKGDWSPDGREIVVTEPEGELNAISVTTDMRRPIATSDTNEDAGQILA
jgi:hypothetical protein